MSYDLVVFDAASAPRDLDSLFEWLDAQDATMTDFDDVSVTTSALRAWFMDMIKDYPAMNGPLAASDAEESRVTDYSIAPFSITAALSYSVAGNGAAHAFRLAQKHRVGFFDMSGGTEAWFP
jgi:hypothetical protein